MSYISSAVLLSAFILAVGCGSDRPSFTDDDNSELGEGGARSASSAANPEEPSNGGLFSSAPQSDPTRDDPGPDEGGSATETAGKDGGEPAEANGSTPDSEPEGATPNPDEETDEETDDAANASPPESSNVDSGSATENPAPAKTPLGEACTSGDECESSFCVDGVCCDLACDGICARCDGPNPGTCSAADADPECPALNCPENAECRTYAGTDLDKNCRALGVCETLVDCVAVDVAPNTACQGGAGTCDGKGQCVVPNKATLGEVCTGDLDCGSGHCAETSTPGARVCCESACSASCNACASDGSCTDQPVDDDACMTVSCQPDTACATFPEPLSADRCAAPGQCTTQALHCTPTYVNEGTSCGSGLACDEAGSCVSICSPGQTWCDACVNVKTDPNHCGMCGKVCTGGSTCSSGACGCPGGEALCSDACVDLQNDANNCGSCGNKCGSGVGSRCVQGDCKAWASVEKVADGPQSEAFPLSAALDHAGNAFVSYMGRSATPSVSVRRRAADGTWSTAALLDDAQNRGNLEATPQVGADKNGNALSVWRSETGFGYSRYKTSTSAWSSAAYVELRDDRDAPRLSVSSAGDGFIGMDNQVTAAGTEVAMRRFAAASDSWSPPLQLDQSDTDPSCLGAVGGAPDGSGLVVYSEAAKVYARWWDPATSTWRAAAQQLNDGNCFVSVGFDGNGKSVVTSTGSANVYGSIATGPNTWSTTALAKTGEFTAYQNHQSAFAGDGGDAIVALEQVQTYTTINLAVWNATTSTWQAISPMLTGSASKDYDGLALAMDSAGNGFLVSSISTGGIVSRRRDGITKEWASEVNVAGLQGGTGGSTSAPVIAMNPKGDAIIVWLEKASDGSFTVWSRSYN